MKTRVASVTLLKTSSQVRNHTAPDDVLMQEPTRATAPPHPAMSEDQPSLPATAFHEEPAGLQSTQAPADDMLPLPVVNIAEPHYYPVSELTEKPTVVQDIAPEMIASLPDGSIQPAIVRLLINEQGGIDQVLIEDSTLSDQARHFVIDSFAQVRFTPGMLGSLPVKSELRIEVTLENASPPVTPVSISVVH